MARHYRKVIRIRAEDSPNVRLAMAERAAGIEPSGEVLVPGVLTWDEYCKRRATWDKIRQTIGLDAIFYEGAEVLMFPPDWLDRAEQRAREIGNRPRRAQGIGIDPAEGGDKTAMAAVDDLGLIELVSKKTPDTSVITGEAVAFMRRHGVDPSKVCFDTGGGGKQHADRLRAMGFAVRTVAFGESIVLDPKRGLRQISERREQKEEKYVHLNRRAQMYWDLRTLLDPAATPRGFAIMEGIRGLLVDGETELRHQLAPIPLTYDKEGRHYLLPKDNPKDDQDDRTLKKLIGHSPDEADALVLAVFAMTQKSLRQTAGAA